LRRAAEQGRLAHGLLVRQHEHPAAPGRLGQESHEPVMILRPGAWDELARANLLVAETDKLDGLPVNVGSGRGVSIREIGETISNALGVDIAPEVNGEFRPGEMRHLTSDTMRVRSAGYEPRVDLAEGIGRYIDWIKAQSDVRDYFTEAARILRGKGIVHRVKVMDA